MWARFSAFVLDIKYHTFFLIFHLFFVNARKPPQETPTQKLPDKKKQDCILNRIS